MICRNSVRLSGKHIVDVADREMMEKRKTLPLYNVFTLYLLWVILSSLGMVSLPESCAHGAPLTFWGSKELWCTQTRTWSLCSPVPQVPPVWYVPLSLRLHRFKDQLIKNFKMAANRALNQDLGFCLAALLTQPGSWPVPKPPQSQPKAASRLLRSHQENRITTSEELPFPEV